MFLVPIISPNAKSSGKLVVAIDPAGKGCFPTGPKYACNHSGIQPFDPLGTMLNPAINELLGVANCQ